MNEIISRFYIKKKKFESFKKILVIGEIGSNHDNDLKKCKKIILEAKKAGCDAVKFQLFKADQLVSKRLNYKGYKILKKIELKEDWIPVLSKFCKSNKILFICSPFYNEAVNLLKKNNCDAIKIASPEIKNIPLVKKIISTNLPVIISTGDSNTNIINRVVKLLNRKNYRKVSFLHCTSQYPCETNNTNLLNILYLKKKLGSKISVGFSDHTLGIDASLMAVSMGANIIEKHITLNRKSKGPDHFFAIEIKELKRMISRIRKLSKYSGKFLKKRLPDENTININIFSKKKMLKNEKILSKNIISKRDIEKGIPSFKINKILGKKLKFDIEDDEKIKYSFLK